jgi:hypothetical protein
MRLIVIPAMVFVIIAVHERHPDKDRQVHRAG